MPAFRFALLVLLTLAAPAAAQTVPIKFTGTGGGPTGLPLPGQDPRLHTIAGTASHLGKHTGAGTVQTDWAAFDPATGKIVGEFGSASPFVFTAANGDKLVTYYGRPDFGAAAPGTFELTIVDVLADGSLVVTAVWTAEFVVQPALSTGRFAGATGSWVLVAPSDPFVLGSDDALTYSWDGEGWLKFARP